MGRAEGARGHGTREQESESERDEDIRRIAPHFHFKCWESKADAGERENKSGAREGGRRKRERRERERERVAFHVQRHGTQN